jgi:putative acetyltransferase
VAILRDASLRDAPQDEVERWYRLVPTLFHLRPYRADDEEAAIALWLETWQKAYPSIDFAARVPWWRTRWRNELVPNAAIMVAEQNDALVGFVTLDATGYLDQLVVAPEQWGSELGNALVAEAKRLSPDRITLLVNSDNARAIRFYGRNGFVHAGEDVNPTSGRPVLRMEWQGQPECPSNIGDAR